MGRNPHNIITVPLKKVILKASALRITFNQFRFKQYHQFFLKLFYSLEKGTLLTNLDYNFVTLVA